MSKMLCSCLIFFAASCLAYSHAPFSEITKRQTNPCNDYMRIRECNLAGDEMTQEEPIKFFRAKTNQMIINFKTDCNFDSMKYQWYLYSETEDKPITNSETSNLLTVPSFYLKEGIYIISADGTLTRNGIVEKFYSECSIKVIALDPVAIIEGGSEKTVEANHLLVLDGSKSEDRDVPPDKPGRLVFKWTCKVLTGPVTDFCQKDYKGSTLKVPSNYVIKDYKYLFTLSVRNQDSSTWISVNQTITVLEHVTELDIICEKNCPPAAPTTDNKQITFLRVKCLKHCSNIEETDYEWTFEEGFDYGFNYDENTQFGRNSDKFVIKGEVLKVKTEYKVRVKLKDRDGTVGKILKVGTPIKIKTCGVQPSEGTAIETKFRVNCSYQGDPYTFEIYTTKNKEKVILTKNYGLGSLEFILPANVQTFIKVTDMNGFQDVFQLDVKVKAINSEKIETYTNSIKTLIERGNLETAVQTANAILAQIETKPSSESQPIKKEILQNLNSVTLKTLNGAQQISHIVASIVHNPKFESDPYQGAIATKLCKQASEIQLEYFKEEYYPSTLLNKAKEISETLMKCGETDSQENFDILKPQPFDFNVTTPFPVLKEPVIQEDYPDYDNDDSAPLKKKKYELTSQNIVGICENNLKMIGLSVVEGEETVAVKIDKCSAQITKMVGHLLMGQEIKIQGASFWLSPDLDTKEVIDVMVCSWQYNPFWWTPGKSVPTNVVLVKVVSKENEIDKFTKPNQIRFDLRKDVKTEVHVIEVVQDSFVRVDVKKGEAFFVEFPKLPKSVRVLISNFYKPTLAEIEKKATEVSEGKILYQEENNGFDSWYYISVLPAVGTNGRSNEKVIKLVLKMTSPI